MADEPHNDGGLRRAILWVAWANLLYFGVEFGVAIWIGSVSLFADGIDFLEDALVNFLVVAALAWSAVNRSRVGVLLAGVLLAPAIGALWTAWEKFRVPVAPAPVPLSVTGVGAMVVNFACATALSKHRHHPGSLVRAAFLSARNDVIANVGIIAAGIITLYYRNAWPDLIVGLVIVLINLHAAIDVYQAAMAEKREPTP